MNQLLTACRDCIFWQRTEADTGNCRRRSPTPINAAMIDVNALHNRTSKAYWPKVCATDWCGEGKPSMTVPLAKLESSVNVFIRKNPGAIQRSILEHFAPTHRSEDLKAAIARLVQSGTIRIEITSRGHQHYSANGKAK